jgi:hypothetical protein
MSRHMQRRTKEKRRAKPKTVSMQSARIDRLIEIVDFAQLETDPYTLFEEARELRTKIATLPSKTTFTLDPEGLVKIVALQGRLRSKLIEIASGKGSATDWEWKPPAVARRVFRNGRDYVAQYFGAFDEMLDNDVLDAVLRAGTSLLRQCLQPGCGKFYVKLRRSEYCAEHGKGRARSIRYRASINVKLSAEEKRERRRRYYLAHLKKHNPARYRHLIRQEMKP